MEEKETRFSRSLRSISSRWNSNFSIFYPGNRGESAGFTLVELLVVIGIVGVLAVGLISLINPSLQIQKTKDSRRKADLKQLQTGLELYRSDTGAYPNDASHRVGNCSSGTILMNDTCDTTTYIQTIPKDPFGVDYYYLLSGTGGYSIYGCAQNGSDSESVPVCGSQPCAPAAVNSYYGVSCSTHRYFKVTNP